MNTRLSTWVALAAILPHAAASAQSDLKINEVSTASVSWIEIANFGTTAVNMSGYKVKFCGKIGTIQQEGTYTVPFGVMLQPNACMVITEDPTTAQPPVPAGVFKAFAGAQILWSQTPQFSGNGTVALNNPLDVGVDRMLWGAPPFDYAQFGSPFTGSIFPLDAVMRRGTPFDTDGVSDWISTAIAAATPGATNPGQANILTLTFSSPAPTALTLSVTTAFPAVPGGEIYNLFSLIDSVPDGSGPFFGVGFDAFLNVLTPASPANPFHTNLDAAGSWGIAVPAGILPPGLHLEGLSILFFGGVVRISPIQTITL